MKKSKDNLLTILYYLTCGIIVSCFCFLFFSALQKINTSDVGAETTDFTIIIDPGHGGEDGGAVSESGILEKDINLDIALKLNDLLSAYGFKTVMTRTTDTAIYDDTAGTLREKKVSDMHKRLEIFNSDSNNIVIGIHQNKFTDSKYSGSQIFYSPNNNNSLVLAESMKNSIVNLIQPENTRETKKADSNIYLLNKSEVTSVIVECGFLSNYEEAEKLNTENYRKEMAFAIYCGFLDYLSTQ